LVGIGEIKKRIKMKPMYGLICGIPEQLKIIEAHCFGDCGKIIVGAIMDETIGELGVCRTAKEQCPQLDKEMDEPFGEIMGDPIFIRKLKEWREFPK
jgi:hypothetical protein